MKEFIELCNLCANLFDYADCSTPAVELPASSQDGFLGSP
jgi:hypothetical protein